MWKRMGAWCALSRSRWTTGIGRAIGLVALVAGFLALLAGASPAAAPILHQPKPTATPQSPGIAIATAQLDLPDPYLFDDGGTYDLFISTALGDQDQHIPVMSGSPGHWSAPIDAVPALPDWASASAGQAGLAWTPAVYKLGGRYLMYFAPTLAVTDHHCLAVGASTSATGKYLVAPAPIVCQWNEGGDIDPQLLVDPKGPDGPGHPNYLIWKSDNNSVTTAGVPMIWAAPLSNDGLRLTGDPVKIFQP
ncbi:MAG TPA: family 43 glycosylhydrolase, partial [Acidimicrobiales bacterium]|nr:family 43 glycosylhydrolase [Acidimicrobiales bacterium]